MKIGFFTDSYFPWTNGVSVSVKSFADALRNLGHEVYIFCPGTAKTDDENNQYVIRFRSFPSIWHEEYRDTIPFTAKNIEQAKSYELDVIHVHTPAQMGIFGARIAKETGVPLVTTYHTDIEQYAEVYRRILLGFIAGAAFGPFAMNDIGLLRDTMKTIQPSRSIRGWKEQVVREGLNVFHNNCDLIIAPSVKMLKVLERYKTKTPIVVIPTGTDPNEAKTASAADTRERYRIAADAPLLMITARLGQEKNIQTLISAVAEVAKERPDVRLLIAGVGPHEEVFVEQTHDLGITSQVLFTGLLSRSDIYAALRDADIFTFPSVMDTQGLVINEAALMGLPLIYVDQDISSITQDGVTGIKAQNNPQSLAEAILLLIEQPELRLTYGKAAREAALKLTMTAQAKALEDQYERLLLEP